MTEDKEKYKVVLVTGASSGIGWATALAFAEKGYRVAICARRTEKLEEQLNDSDYDRATEILNDMELEFELTRMLREFIIWTWPSEKESHFLRSNFRFKVEVQNAG